MAVHHRLPAITAAALATAMLRARWQASRATHDAHGASAAKAPWRRTAPPPAAAGTADDRVADLHTSYMGPALRETDAHLEQHWNKIKSLYPHRDSERRHR
ncbi:hypothetical protein [Streptomyces sp. NBC_00207]|uniref:hypothetical protein n=1 Tax=unclassified Streptomyces TaxID=2593676 RepID=UPI002885402F|nr:hypothetical protein [Streptomyces sp. DSM 41633]